MNGDRKKTSIKQRIIAAILLAALAAFAVLSGDMISRLNMREGYSDWLGLNPEPKTCIIDIWHIVGFKPYIGSIGTWLAKRSDEYKKSMIGVYFNVKSLTPYQAEQALSRGMRPDIISFTYGDWSEDGLLPLDPSLDKSGELCTQSGKLDGVLLALPYCASGRVLLYDGALTTGMTDEELTANAGTAEQFKKGKAYSCVCDLRTAGDIYRAGLAGNAPYFEAKPYMPEDDDMLVQFIGVSSDIEEYKLKYAFEFIDFITNKKAQSTLCELGLIPVVLNAGAEYEQSWITELWSRFDIFDIECCFGGRH